ncbi:MAG: hypothetical protein AAB449_01510 [Patescibacteria group bacterium]
MDLEQLTKHQIILLTLLVSFVTSIATGIVTVSLMDQAPQSVTQTINRIVERTVEKVVPTDLSALVTTEKTVIVKDDQLAAQSIASVQKAIIRITAVNNPTQLLARGVIVGKGIALTDRGALAASGATQFEAILYSGDRAPISIVAGTSPIAVVAIGTSTPALATLGDASKLQLGQSVIRIGGTGTDNIGVGVVAQLPSSDHPKLIEASVSSATPGSILLTIFGEVVGMITADSLAVSAGAEFYSVADSVPAP